MGDDRKTEYEMAPTSDPENPEPPAEKAELQTEDDNSQQWAGLGKEELLRVADTPAWNWARNILLVLFWVAWILMLVVAIVLVVKAPSCPNVEWYQKSSIYQVHVRSYQDSDGDGFGDLKGLTDRVKKIKEDFGAETIVLSPIFEQANGTTQSASYGYNIVDFKNIDPILGTLDDFKALVEEVQVNGMHIVLEFGPNHSSDEHEWFMESKMSKDNMYRDFYIWAPGTNGGPPNNWKNYKGEEAWTQLQDGEEYYYHFYEPTQPDLNFATDSKNATAAIKDAMNFWLKTHKVDGFVIADADRLLEGPIMTRSGRRRREVDANDTDTTTEMSDITTVYMGMDETEAMETSEASDNSTQSPSGQFVQYVMSGGGVNVSDAVKVLDDLYRTLYENSYLGKFRVFIPQHSGNLEQNTLYQKMNWRGFPSSLSFANQIDDSMTTYNIMDHLTRELADGMSNVWNGWMIGHAGVSRVASRASKSARALTMLLYTLPGTPMPFYGDELGLTDLSSGESPQLAPYPWDNSQNGGFMSGNTSTTWQSVVDDLENVNAEAQDGVDSSFLNFVQNLTAYRSKPSILAGSFNITATSDKFFSYMRSFPEWPAYVIAINLDDKMVKDMFVLKDTMGTLVLSALGITQGGSVDLSRLTVHPNDAYLIEIGTM